MDEIIGNEEYLYRGVVGSCWNFAENRPSSAAFKDSQGVSVDRDGGRSQDVCVKALLSKKVFYAVCRLTAGDARACDTVVKYLPVEGNDYHSEIHDSETRAQIKSPKKAKNLLSKTELSYSKG